MSATPTSTASTVAQVAQQPASQPIAQKTPVPSTPVVLTVPQAATPTGTLSISVTPPPTAPVPLGANVVLWVSILSFIGVVITVWQAHVRLRKELGAAETRLQTQLKASANEATIERNQSRDQANLDRQHDADQAHQERITKARREVYLELIAEMTTAQIALGRMPQHDLEKIDISAGFGGLIAATSKVSVLGEMKTVTASRELLTLVQQIMMKGITLLIPIYEHRATREFHEQQLQYFETELKTVELELEDLQRKTMLTPRTRELAELQRHLVEKRLKHAHATVVAINAMTREQRVFHTEVLNDMKLAAEKTNELIYLMRMELALDTSLEELMNTNAAMYATAVASLEQVNAAIDARSKDDEDG